MEFRKRYVYNPKVDLLGKGGFSRVFRANDVLLEREVALKVFNPEQSAQYDLITEIKKVIKFQQENLCRYYDVAILETVNAFGEDEQMQVGVMEYLDGGELKTYLKKNPHHMNKLLCDVLKGLAYLHKRSIIHRDLKPQNILIKLEDDEPIAKITDFGISKAIGSVQENASALVGTVEYMAPEQFNPAKYGINGEISTHIDLWSFGIMVYELIEGENLFGSRSRGTSAEMVMANILNEEYSHKLAALPAPYNEVVAVCLKKMASQRVQSADVLLGMLSGNVADSKLFSGLSNQNQNVNDETTLIPGNLQARVDEPTDLETQLISYNLTDEILKQETPVEKISGNIFDVTDKVPVNKPIIADDVTQVIDFNKINLPEAKPVQEEPKKPVVSAPPVIKQKDLPPVKQEEVNKVEVKEETIAPVIAPAVEPVKKTPPIQNKKASPTLNESLATKAKQLEHSVVADQKPQISTLPTKKKSNGLVIGLGVFGIIVLIAAVVFLYSKKTDQPVALTENPVATTTEKPPVANKEVAVVPKSTNATATAGTSVSSSKMVSGLTLSNGSYTGRTVNGVPDGKGELKFSNGDLYSGGFANGQFSGKGTLTSSNGEKYVGNWAGGKKTNGTLYYIDGTLYRGTFKGEMKHGKGKFMFKDATYYEGEFKNDQFNGQGKIFTASGELTKSGLFKNGVMISE